MVTRNRAIFLDRLINALKLQSYENFELIVVLGPCDEADNSREILASFPDIRLYETEWKNISHARNIGLFLAAGEIVAFIDDDAIPEPSWLENLVAQFEDLKIGLVGGNVRLPNGIDFQFRGAVVNSLGLDEKVDLKIGPAPISYTPIGANFAVRRSAAMAIGGFDNVFAYYFDETDLAHRMEIAGYSLFHTDNAEVIHFQGVGIYRSQDNRPTSYLGIARSKVYFALKHGIRDYSFSVIQEYINEYVEQVFSSLEVSHQLYGLSKDREISLKASFLRGIEEGYEYAITGPPKFDYIESHPESFKLFHRHKSKKSVVIASRSYDGADSGIGVWTKDIACQLSRIGHPVTIIAETNSLESVTFESPGYWVHRVNPAAPSALSIPGHVSTRISGVANAFADVSMRRRVDVFQYPIWDVEGIEIPDEHLRNVETILSLHTTYGMTINDHPEWFLNNKLTSPYQNLLDLEKTAMIKVDSILANSKAIVSDIEDFYNIEIHSKAIIIPHGVEVKNESDKLPDLNHIVFLGRLESRKGIDIFLEAISTYAKSNDVSNLRVSIIGKETESFNSKKWREKNKILDFVEFLGFVDDDKVEEILLCKPIVCIPSRYESFGLVALEALSFGCVVLAARVGGLPEVVFDKSTGLIFEPENPNMIAAQLKYLKESPEVARNLSNQAIYVSKTQFSNISVGQIISDFYQNLKNKSKLNFENHE
jgi:glycosyltransferase involved in cell wall biosynthesis/GT2 family glycosyltransferase